LKINNLPYYRIVFVLLVLGMFLNSCSTKKNTWTRRAFHNVTAHYNGWWNGNESLKEGVLELEKNKVDNYNKILEVYNYGDDQLGQSLSSYSDRAIEKGSIVAQQHSMWFKKREHVKWVPQSYLLIGKGYFYKHEFQSARMTFEFITKKYHYDEVQFEAMLWLAKTYIEIENYQKAETFLDQLNSKIGKDDVPKDVIKDIDAVYADLYIKMGTPEAAEPYLEKAIFQIRKKKINTRLTYILAQINQEKGNATEAQRLYNIVLKRNTEYKTTFNAKMNLAQLYDAETSDSRALVKSLKKMLKDVKNIHYKDQIYYALAEVSISDKEMGLAKDYLRKSVAYSVENDFQKAVSSLDAAHLFYDDKNFKLSAAYYDTAMMYLPEDYPNYRQVKRQTAIVSDLVNNLKVVQIEDSLQFMAAMPRPELNALIDSMIQVIVEEEERQREEERMRQQAIAMGAQNRRSMGPGMGSPVGGGGWYFYNPQALSMGFSEFIAKWGSRKLEDNWRLSNKQSTSFDLEELDGEITADSLSVVDSNAVMASTDPKDRNYYLQTLPLTPELLVASDEKIANALYQAGFIYKESLQEYPESIMTFEDFTERNEEEHELSIQVYFQLYLLYDQAGNEPKALYYKDLIVGRYPDSDYAKLLLDPDYFKELEKKNNYLTDLYEKTYKAYEKGQYTMVVYNSDQALEVNKEDLTIPKFLYLKAISMAKTDVVDSMVVNLEKLVEEYPNAEVTPLAQNILTNLGLYDPDAKLSPEELREKQQMEAAHSLYEIKKDSPHYVILVIDGTLVSVNATKIRISDYNKKSHSADDLSVSSLIFDGVWQMITINKFKNARGAMMYYRDMVSNAYVFPDGMNESVKAVVISVDNYTKLYHDKDIEKYTKLFEKEYEKN